MDAKTVSKLIRKVPDYPRPGVMFRDITPLLADADVFADVVEAMSTRIEAHHARALVALEARGFLFGAAIASRLQMPLHIARKPGKLPRETVQRRYALEYGDDGLDLHADAFAADTRCAIVDDVLATGGTAAAASELIRALGAKPVCCVVLLELESLGGRQRLGEVPVESLLVDKA